MQEGKAKPLMVKIHHPSVRSRPADVTQSMSSNKVNRDPQVALTLMQVIACMFRARLAACQWNQTTPLVAQPVALAVLMRSDDHTTSFSSGPGILSQAAARDLSVVWGIDN